MSGDRHVLVEICLEPFNIHIWKESVGWSSIFVGLPDLDIDWKFNLRVRVFAMLIVF